MRRKKNNPVFFDCRAFDAALGASGHRTVAELARVLGVTPKFLYSVRHGLVPQETKQRAISEALGVPAGFLWRPIAPEGRAA